MCNAAWRACWTWRRGSAAFAIGRVWSGVEGYLPDMLPVIGWSRTTPGFMHAFGFSGHGFQLAPGVGAVVADLIAEGRTETGIEAFSIARFAGGVMPDARLWQEFDPDLVSRFRPGNAKRRWRRPTLGPRSFAGGRAAGPRKLVTPDVEGPCRTATSAPF